MIRVLLTYLLLFSAIAFSQNQDALFTDANKLYQQEKYVESLELYQQIEKTKQVSSELYYNIGNCYYKLNKVAPTIYYYEKALQLNPLNSDAQNNLVFAKRLTLDNIEELPKSVFQKIDENYLQKLSFNQWAVVTILLSFLASLLFLLFYFTEISSKKRLYFVSSIVAFLLLISSIFITQNQYKISKSNVFAIIYEQEVTIKNAPTSSSEEIFKLHEGTKVKILDSVDSWKKIKLADGKVGWILTKDLKEI